MVGKYCEEPSIDHTRTKRQPVKSSQTVSACLDL